MGQRPTQQVLPSVTVGAHAMMQVLRCIRIAAAPVRTELPHYGTEPRLQVSCKSPVELHLYAWACSWHTHRQAPHLEALHTRSLSVHQCAASTAPQGTA